MFRFISCLAVGLLVPLTTSAGETVTKSLMHDGRTRSYIVYVPDQYTGADPWPVVLNIHGATGNASGQANISRMNPVADANDFLVAYPNAIGGLWNDVNRDSAHDDVGFLGAMINDLQGSYNVNASRVYATGFSQVGAMTYLMAYYMPDRIAAVASVAGLPAYKDNVGVLDFDMRTSPTTSRALPMLHMHGTSDPVLDPTRENSPPVPSNPTTPRLSDFLNAWVANNSCDVTAAVTDLPNLVMDDGPTRVRSHQFQNCESYTSAFGATATAEVVHFEIDGGGHTWPGGNPLPFGATNRDINASEEIWEFFSRHALPQMSSVGSFRDEFTDANELDGIPVSWRPAPGFSAGTRDASSGDLVITANGVSGTFADREDSEFSDVSIRTQVRMSGPDGTEVGVFGRLVGANAMLASLDSHGDIGIWTLMNGIPSNRGLASLGLDPRETDVLMQFDMFRDQYSLTAWSDGSEKPASPQVTWQDINNVFQLNAGKVGVFQDHPLAAQTVATYRWIEVVVPPPSCDLDGNGTCGLADVDALTSAIIRGSMESRFDLNADSLVSVGDLHEWLSMAATENGFSEPYLPGDADLDGTVGAADLNQVALNWRSAVDRWNEGDFNADGMVDAGDLNSLALNWRESISAAAATSAVPESGTEWLPLLGVFVLATATRRESNKKKCKRSVNRWR